MSAALQGSIWPLDMKMADKIVLLKMADCGNDNGEGIWLAIETIAAHCGCSVRNVQNAIKRFLESGVVEVESEPYQWERKGRKMPSRLYRIDRKRVQDMQGAGHAPSQDIPKEGAGGAPNTLDNPYTPPDPPRAAPAGAQAPSPPGGKRARQRKRKADDPPPARRPVAAPGVTEEWLGKWTRIRGRLRAEYGEGAYRSWLAPLMLVGPDGGGVAVIRAPNGFMLDWVAGQYGKRLDELWRGEGAASIRLELEKGGEA